MHIIIQSNRNVSHMDIIRLIDQIKAEFNKIDQNEIYVLVHIDEIVPEEYKKIRKIQKKLSNAYETIQSSNIDHINNESLGIDLFFIKGEKELKIIIEEEFQEYINYYWDWLESKDSTKILELIFNNLH